MYTNYSCQSKNLFRLEKQAISALAFAQLSQLVSEINGEWRADFNNIQGKYSIDRIKNDIRIEICWNTYKPLCFEKKEDAEFSLLHHKQLWKQFFEL